MSDYTQDQWRLWTNVDGHRDAGLSLQDMTKAQRLKALAILKAGMSARGLRNADKVRHLNLYGGQLVDLTDQFNDELYWLTIMGTPSATEPWGWQFEGHHLVVNYFVLGDQVVMVRLPSRTVPGSPVLVPPGLAHDPVPDACDGVGDLPGSHVRTGTGALSTSPCRPARRLSCGPRFPARPRLRP
ncbi:DUF3500 domain-containing protein [Streptomyces sp. NPDC057757]|uniref:DUF3500 domain-containing protein n=1 Tax=Streptomyces sp. NPDC057757 TaxID=3346241 RepID=UPI0036A71B85